MPVADASVVFTYLAGGDQEASARDALSDGEELWAPHLVDAEVGQALRRSVRSGRLSVGEARAALVDLAEMALQRASHGGLLDRAWALRDNLSFYDALYVALAEALDTPLITFDARIARAPGLRASVEVLD